MFKQAMIPACMHWEWVFDASEAAVNAFKKAYSSSSRTAVLIPAFLQQCPGHTDLLTSSILSAASCHCQPTAHGLWLQTIKRQEGAVLPSPAAMGSGAFTLVLTLGLVACITPAEKKVWGWVVMGMWHRLTPKCAAGAVMLSREQGMGCPSWWELHCGH